MTHGPVAQIIRQKLEKSFAPERLEVIDESDRHAGHAGAHAEGESHFRIDIVSQAFSGKSRIDRHRMINEALATLLKSRVHALAIRAHAPEDDPTSADASQARR
jgi:BolA protein